ncbi:hypothetical protein DPV78_007007 [Talaromyces pinophilus]|nr:hypothetical protein DPV78_007007 [Talaromyces pinophilus]
MVFSGKPSRGCFNCRTKKKKCDQGLPSCRRCLRSGINCSGYRSELDVNFHDQTIQVIRRVRAERRSITPPAPSTTRSIDSFSEPATQCGEEELVSPRSLSLPIDDQAVCFFFLNYVLMDTASDCGHFEYLPAMYGATPADAALPAAIAAVGVAGMANLGKDPELFAEANTRYLAAIKLTQAALTDAFLRTQSQTLVSVLLLAMYETVTCCSPQSMRIWSSHIAGATALISQFAQQQMRNGIGLRILSDVRTQAIIRSLQRHEDVPTEIQRCSTETQALQSAGQAHQYRLHQLAMGLCTLRAAVKSGTITDTRLIVCEAWALDGKLADWLRGLVADHGYMVTDLSSKVGKQVTVDRVHKTPDVHTTSVLNNCRTLRILANELILDTLNQATDHCDYSSQRLVSQFLLQVLTSEICASVSSLISGSDLRQPGLGAVGSFLLWPLYTMAAVPWTSLTCRDWVINQLHVIGTDMGIQQAVSLAEALRIKGEVTVWYKEIDTAKDDW